MLILGAFLWLANKVEPHGDGEYMYEWEEIDERGRKIRVRRAIRARTDGMPVTELFRFCKYSPLMLSSTIVLSGKTIVENVLFSWWVTDGAKARLTVSHPVHGTETRPLADTEPRTQARAIAKAILDRTATRATNPNATVVLGEEYHQDVAGGFTGIDEGESKD